MKPQFCQCCAMPMDTEEVYGTEADASKNSEYCKYCYENGDFTFHGTMDEMIQVCIPHMVEGNPGMTPEQAKKMMEEYFPTLKHWQSK